MTNNINSRKRKDKLFHIFAFLITCFGILVLIVLFTDVLIKGIPWLTANFLTGFPSRFPNKAGILPGLVGSAYIIVLTIAFSLPVGLGCAIYLEEFAKNNWLTKFIKINISNLSGTPSIVYGLLGLAVFVKLMKLGTTVLSGAFTMTIVVLPIIIVASQESIKAVPNYLKEGALALGATRWQTVRKVILPTAFPGILTGIILSVSRALGETAPIVMVGAATFVSFLPSITKPGFTAIPMQIYDWTGRPQADFQNVAAAGIIVLLFLLISTNAVAIFLRNKYQRKAD